MGMYCKEMLEMNPSFSGITRSNCHSFTVIYIFLLITSKAQDGNLRMLRL